MVVVIVVVITFYVIFKSKFLNCIIYRPNHLECWEEEGEHPKIQVIWIAWEIKQSTWWTNIHFFSNTGFLNIEAFFKQHIMQVHLKRKKKCVNKTCRDLLQVLIWMVNRRSNKSVVASSPPEPTGSKVRCKLDFFSSDTMALLIWSII